ncbi:MAG: hypothetical protein IT204_15170 [Fimbriimonadaceae bacterium]|nr:hypothetical protein [Fimbriimonadaceae bacterium]
MIIRSTTGAITTIFNDLVSRYKDLEEIGKSFAGDPRLVVVGAPDSAVAEVYATFYGEPAERLTQAGDEGEWEACSSFRLEQLPGLGVYGPSLPADRPRAYLAEADVVLFCLLHDRLPTALERALYSHLKSLRRPVVTVVHTPVASLTSRVKHRDPAVQSAWRGWELELRRALGDRDLKALPLRGTYGPDLVCLARAVHEKLDPKLQLRLIHHLPPGACRHALLSDLINATARTCAFLGLSPIEYADTIAMTPLQVLLVCRIAAVSGRRITARLAADFVTVCGAVIGAGSVCRGVYRRIRRGWGDPALPVTMALGSAVAWAGTQVIGHAARLYFGGEQPSIPQAAEAAAEELASQSLLGLR